MATTAESVTAAARAEEIASAFSAAHDLMRSDDGLQPPEALDELLKVLFLLLYRERQNLPSLRRERKHHRDGSSEPESVVDHATRAQAAFTSAVRSFPRAASPFPTDAQIRLKASTISQVVTSLSEHRFSDLAVDLKSVALRTFLAGALRRGLGIYLTPDSVVRAAIDVLRPPVGARVIDPACGSGSFLLHTLHSWGKRAKGTEEFWGYDYNERVLRVARVNLLPLLGERFRSWPGDALRGFGPGHAPWFKPKSFDYVFTNPPFGVTVGEDVLRESGFSTSAAKEGSMFPERVGSEVVFVERCLELLAPGGYLAIVLPNSVATIARYEKARGAIDGLGQLLAVIALPPETFLSTGTQTTTSVLFFRRREPRPSKRFPEGRVLFAQSQDVGFDTTGRATGSSDLGALSTELNGLLFGTMKKPERVRVLDLAPGQELSTYAAQGSRAPVVVGGRTLKDVAVTVRVGKTPARAAYVGEGAFVVKVGNLTGNGIDWFPRDRNFVGADHVERFTKRNDSLILRVGDILFTSSAHSSKYIAKKVDVVSELPAWVPGPVTFVGELMLVRPNLDKIDPYFLLGYLRSPKARAALQAMVRGQTAHLHPDDAASLPVPPASKASQKALADLRAAFLEEARTNTEAAKARQDVERLCSSIFG